MSGTGQAARPSTQREAAIHTAATPGQTTMRSVRCPLSHPASAPALLLLPPAPHIVPKDHPSCRRRRLRCEQRVCRAQHVPVESQQQQEGQQRPRSALVGGPRSHDDPPPAAASAQSSPPAPQQALQHGHDITSSAQPPQPAASTDGTEQSQAGRDAPPNDDDACLGLPSPADQQGGIEPDPDAAAKAAGAELQSRRGANKVVATQRTANSIRTRSLYFWPPTRHARDRPSFQEHYPPDGGVSYNINSFLGPLDTHGGKLYVPPAQYQRFLTEYHDAFHAGYQLFLSERYASQPFRYFLELDFPWELPQPLVAHAFSRLLPLLRNAISKSYQLHSPISMLISMRTAYKVHINCPSLVTTELQAMMCRDQIIDQARKFFSGDGGVPSSSSSVTVLNGVPVESHATPVNVLALDREAAALMDWESIIDFPHGSFRMLGSRKSKQLTMNKEPAWVMDKAYYPVRYVHGQGWLPCFMSLQRICESSIIPTPEQRERFEKSVAYVRFIYADASAYEQRMRDKIQAHLDGHKAVVTHKLVTTAGAAAGPIAPSSAHEALAAPAPHTSPLAAAPSGGGPLAGGQALASGGSAEGPEDAGKQRRKMEAELQKLRSLTLAQEKQQHRARLQALAEVTGGVAGQRYLLLVGQRDRMDTELRVVQAKLALLRRQRDLLRDSSAPAAGSASAAAAVHSAMPPPGNVAGAADGQLPGGSGSAGARPRPVAEPRLAEVEGDVQQLQAEVSGLQRLLFDLRHQLAAAEKALLGNDPAAACSSRAAQAEGGQHESGEGAPPLQELINELKGEVASAKQRVAQVQSHITALTQLHTRMRASGREPHPDDKMLCTELKREEQQHSRELDELERRLKEALAKALTQHGSTTL